MTTGEQIQAELEDAEQALAEHETLTARLARAEESLAAADRAVKEARARLDHETDQVRRLESISTTRIWAALNGSREERLSVEKAEREAAEYAVAAAKAERESRATERNDVLARLRALGDPAARRTNALAAKEEWLTSSGSGLGTELAELARRTGALREERREIGEARDAGLAALRTLDDAAGHLGSAQSWSTYDTFFGGGMLSSAMKYDRMDDATALMRHADAALQRLGRELADVGMQTVGALEVSSLTRTFDVWFDNIFSDLAARDRIRQATERLTATRAGVVTVLGQLDERRAATDAELERLAANRESLLLR